MGYWNYFPRYVSVAEKKAKAGRKLEQLKKKNPDIKPVIIEGRTIATTWWGKSWNLNLERYADYSNRIGRGRSYVRHGAVLDLQIRPGEVVALVQGTRSKPYAVNITIKAVNKKIWQDMIFACEGQLESLQELLAGKFPQSLNRVFTAQGQGLFPSPQEIDFNCSCPDWAYMCKHVAAALYGIGSRLDEDPGLFFSLRKCRMKDLITQAVEDRSRELLQKAETKTSRVIAEGDLAEVFGIDLDEPAAPAGRQAKTPKKKSKKKVSAKTRAAGAKPEPKAGKKGRKKPAPKASTRRPAKTPYDTVVAVVRRSRKGVKVAQIKEKTGFKETEIRNFVVKARREGKIRNLERGVYISA